MEVISHFSHEHPLVILKQFPTGLIDDQEIECYICRKPLLKEGEDDESDEDDKSSDEDDKSNEDDNKSSDEDDKSNEDVYGCELCKSFFLHKSCAQLPTEIVHRSHEQHSLFLTNDPQYAEEAYCDVCKDEIDVGFFYHCDICQFDLDLKCVSKDKDNELIDMKKDLNLKHLDHEHPLTLFPRPASFHCNACDVEAKDFSYQCAPCNYCIHRRCALLPSTARRTDHPHLLSLCFRLPSEYHIFDYYCYICEKTLYKYKRMWFYYCNLCRYFVHIKCMETYKPPQADLIMPDNLLFLPATDMARELIQRFLLKVDSLPDIEAEKRIFSHTHPLKLCYERITEDDIDDNDDEEILCDVCVQPITSPPYYCCAECKYLLHIPCANLPRKHKYQNHPHTLNLGCKTKFYDTFYCDMCKKMSNGFYYSCEEEGCCFLIEVKCAALPFLIEHESHSHPLQIWKHAGNMPSCRGCTLSVVHSDCTLGCSRCKFYLHMECALRPRTVWHIYDSKHPLVLRFPPHDYHPRPFDCFKCEKEINPMGWLYHCDECDLSFHTFCIPRFGISSGVKCGQRIQISYHPHPLQFVRMARINSVCHRCGIDEDECLVFECQTCNFGICRLCVSYLEATPKIMDPEASQKMKELIQNLPEASQKMK